MKILYVDLLYDYGIKSRGINSIGQDGFKASFENLGHDVQTFYYDDYFNDICLLQSDLIEKAEILAPDIIFFSIFKDQIMQETLLRLKERFITINWFGDDQWRFDNFTNKYCNLFTYCITTDVFSIPKYYALGQKNVIYSQWAAIDKHSIPVSEDYVYDVSFVGGMHPHRKWFIEQLKKNGIHVEAFGHGWPNGPLESKEMNEIFSKSKINLNLSNSISYDFRFIFHSIKSFITFFRSKKDKSQIKARNFEIPYFNGFQLTDYVPSLDEYFVIGKEVACYTNVEEAVLQIKYFLENDELREKIKKEGHLRAVSEHGYISRIESILKEIQ
ncbi:CgeB family protein [Marinospirillum minutulum]|uniref:CgeB family protein n=1 Tax=Marinospirillum minutulum TaxID=64974 RepID=UPI00047FF3D4|nr:glycosyltransferase [Marinospirillum minutulum]